MVKKKTTGREHNKKETNQKYKENKEKKKKEYKKEEFDHETRLLNEELGKIGLTIKEIYGDGNCLFRSVSDQINNDQEDYNIIRHKTMEYIKQNKSDFEHFVYDETFEEVNQINIHFSTWIE
jgi:OTU domain-containing protein 3